MAISPVTQTNAAAVTNAAVKQVNQEVAQAKPQPPTTDTVQLSSAAKAALQEATETTVQTAAEAAKESPAAKGQESPGMSVSDVL